MKSLETKSTKFLGHAAFAMAPFLIVAGLLAPAVVKARLGIEGILGSPGATHQKVIPFVALGWAPEW